MKNGYITYHKDFESIFDDIKKVKIGKLITNERTTLSMDDFFLANDSKVEYYDDNIVKVNDNSKH